MTLPGPPERKIDRRFRWTERLHRSAEFDRVFESGKRFRTSGLTIWVGQDFGTGPPRLGLAISRHYGNAVARNRLKRLLREVFRLHKAELPVGVDLVFAARPMGNKLRFQTVEALVSTLWIKAALIKSPLASPPSSSAPTSC